MLRTPCLLRLRLLEISVEPGQHTPQQVELVAALDEGVGLARVEHQLRGHAVRLEPAVELVGLRRRHDLIPFAVQDQRGRAHLCYILHRRAVPVGRGIAVGQVVEVEAVHIRYVVLTVVADQVGGAGAGHSSLE